MKNGTYSTHLKGKTINFLLFSGITRDYRKRKGIEGNYKGLKDNSKAKASLRPIGFRSIFIWL